MKVLLIAPVPPPYGGISNWTNLMDQYISKNDPNVKMDIMNIAPKKRSTEGRNYFDRVVVSGMDMLSKNNDLKKYIKNNNIDVIHMTTSGQLAIIRDVMLLKTAKNNNIKTVYHIRFGRIKEISEKNTKEWQRITTAMTLATVVVAIDKTTFQTIKQKLPKVNVVYIPNPIDVSRLPDISSEKDKTIMFLGWMVKTKGVEELIDAFNIVGEKYPNYKLNLVGPALPEYKSELEKKVKVDNVCFVGEKNHEEAMDMLSRCSIFILPSYTEGFPNSVVEAMALRKPVIGTKVGAIPDMLSIDCGIVINPQSKEDIVDALLSLIDDEDKQDAISKNAYKKATENYSIEIVYKHYYSLWETIIKKECGDIGI